jgi:hypothetical protein
MKGFFLQKGEEYELQLFIGLLSFGPFSRSFLKYFILLRRKQDSGKIVVLLLPVQE